MHYIIVRSVINITKSEFVIVNLDRFNHHMAKTSKYQTIQCEGDLAYFNDSILRPYNFNGSIENYLYMVIESHNSQVGDDKKFTLGDVTVTDPNDYYSASNLGLRENLG